MLIDLRGATLERRFTATEHEYRAKVAGRGPVTLLAWPSSSRIQSLTIDGKRVKPGAAFDVPHGSDSKTLPIVVTAADGQTTQTYHVTLSR